MGPEARGGTGSAGVRARRPSRSRGSDRLGRYPPIARAEPPIFFAPSHHDERPGSRATHDAMRVLGRKAAEVRRPDRRRSELAVGSQHLFIVGAPEKE